MTATWQQFAAQSPELAAIGEAQFARTGLALVGTFRRDGWPRISPVEPFIVDGLLYLGMTWRSVKALDLLRDPRCVVQTRSPTVKARRGSSRCTGAPSRSTTWTNGEGSATPYTKPSDFAPRNRNFTASPSPSRASRSPSYEMVSFTTWSGKPVKRWGSGASTCAPALSTSHTSSRRRTRTCPWLRRRRSGRLLWLGPGRSGGLSAGPAAPWCPRRSGRSLSARPC